jgi:LPXTG-motif cell wall-anchored protein
MLVMGVLALSVPAVTLANGGGGSAGDQQYTDPFAGTSTPTSTSHTTPPATATAPATTSFSQPVPVAAPATGTTSDPTATIAATSTNQLPYTGYDGWLAAALGFVMVAGGMVLRRRMGRS